MSVKQIIAVPLVFPLPPRQVVQMPKGAQILSFHGVSGATAFHTPVCYLHVLCDPTVERESTNIHAIGSNSPITADTNCLVFISTVSVSNFTWHLFYEIDPIVAMLKQGVFG